MIRILTILIIATIPVLFASVQPWVWAGYTAAFFTIFLIAVWNDNLPSVKPSDRIILIPALIFFTLTLFQCLPLSSLAANYINPYHNRLLTESQVMIGRSETWHSVSYSPKDSFEWWLFGLSLFCFLWIFKKQLYSDRNLSLFIRVLIIVATFEALYGIIQTLVPGTGVLWADSAYPGCACGTYINRNHFAGFIAMIWPLALGYTLSIGNYQERIDFSALLSSDHLNLQLLYTLTIIIMLFALLCSKSRGGIIAGITGILTFIWLLRKRYRSRSIMFPILMGVIISFLILYGSQIGLDPIIERFQSISGGDGRSDIWKDGIAILKDHPFGIGLNNTPNVLPVYQINYDTDLNAVHLHNDYLQLLVETGPLGFLAIIIGGFLFLWKSISMIGRWPSNCGAYRFYIAIGALSGLISILVHSFFDFNLQIPANCFYFVMLIGIVQVCLWAPSSDEADITLSSD